MRAVMFAGFRAVARCGGFAGRRLGSRCGGSDEPSELTVGAGGRRRLPRRVARRQQRRGGEALTAELRARYERYPQCTALATRLLDVQYAGLTSGTIRNEASAPTEMRRVSPASSRASGSQADRGRVLAARGPKESGKWPESVISASSGGGWSRRLARQVSRGHPGFAADSAPAACMDSSAAPVVRGVVVLFPARKRDIHGPDTGLTPLLPLRGPRIEELAVVE